ncbi:MAG: hypothetical protein JKY19_16335 [Alcanivoracaceae bacterium]|nr:hypothetical protein [Alcanivoracaceae bacterium]
MTNKQLLIFILFAINSLSVLAEDGGALNYDKFDSQYLESTPIRYNDDWIKIKSSPKTPVFSVLKNQDITFGDELAIAWNLSNFLSVNLSVFDTPTNNYIANVTPNPFNQNISQNKSLNTLTIQQPLLDVNRNLSGYKLGVSSEMGIGNNYKLNIKFNYGQLEEANLAGFNSNEINTTSFTLGIRKAKFGASINTDSYLEDNVDLIDHSRLGLEFDWHFSDDTTISFGTKQRLNSNSYLDRSHSLDSLTGDVQYIKFKHNL